MSTTKIATINSNISPIEFFEKFVVTSTPCIIKGALIDWGWTCLDWDKKFLLQYSNEKVNVAPLRVPDIDCPDIFYKVSNVLPERRHRRAYWDKWIEPSSEWASPDHFQEDTPGVLIKDLVLAVAGDRRNMSFGEFLQYLGDDEAVEHVERRDGVTFYADGAGNLEQSFSFLPKGWILPPISDNVLLLKRVDLWLGRRSVSRLHFDNLDNLFGQVIGSKRFRLIHPKYSKLFVNSRIRKAWYSYEHSGKFSKSIHGLTGSDHNETVINYSTLDIDNPDLVEFPDFNKIEIIDVIVEAGDLLYLPFAWWHQVYAIPCKERGMCFSVTHFYHPFYCRIQTERMRRLGPVVINLKYKDILNGLGKSALDVDEDAGQEDHEDLDDENK